MADKKPTDITKGPYKLKRLNMETFVIMGAEKNKALPDAINGTGRDIAMVEGEGNANFILSLMNAASRRDRKRAKR